MKEIILTILCEYFCIGRITEFKKIPKDQAALKSMAVALVGFEMPWLGTTATARLFGINHSTVVHHQNKHRDYMEIYPKYKQHFLVLAELIETSAQIRFRALVMNDRYKPSGKTSPLRDLTTEAINDKWPKTA